MTTHQPAQPERFSDDELRDLLTRVLSSIRGSQPLDEDEHTRIARAVASRP